MSKIILNEEGITLVEGETTFFKALEYGLYDTLIEEVTAQ